MKVQQIRVVHAQMNFQHPKVAVKSYIINTLNFSLHLHNQYVGVRGLAMLSIFSFQLDGIQI
jgi:hypothetical protein